MTLHVNLYAGPGVGKSTTAAGLFFFLKMRATSCELVQEYARELVFNDTIHTTHQMDILQAQYARQAFVHQRTNVVITDAPLSMSYVYSNPELHPEITTFLQRVEDWKTLNVLLERDISTSYAQEGRYQPLNEAQKVHAQIKRHFHQRYPQTGHVLNVGTPDSMEKLVSLVLSSM